MDPDIELILIILPHFFFNIPLTTNLVILNTLFKLEENLRIVGVLTVGYPKPQPSKKRKKVEDVTKWI